MIDRLSENDIIGENRARHQDKRITGNFCQLDPSVCLCLISTQQFVNCATVKPLALSLFPRACKLDDFKRPRLTRLPFELERRYRCKPGAVSTENSNFWLRESLEPSEVQSLHLAAYIVSYAIPEDSWCHPWVELFEAHPVMGTRAFRDGIQGEPSQTRKSSGF